MSLSSNTNTFGGQKLLRCDCGFAMNFLEITKCASCSKAIQKCCKKPVHKKPYCKKCSKIVQRELSK